MYIDRIDLTLPDADIAILLASFLSAGETLQLLPSVSDSDRKRYAKLGLKNEGLARRIIEVGRLHPDVIPRGINFELIHRDLVARDQLLTLKLVLEGLLGKVNGSMLLTGVDIYAAALSIYHCLRRNAGTTGLRDVVEELKRGFARPSRKKNAEEATPVTALPSAEVANDFPPPPSAAMSEPESSRERGAGEARQSPTEISARRDARSFCSSAPVAEAGADVLPINRSISWSGFSVPPRHAIETAFGQVHYLR